MRLVAVLFAATVLLLSVGTGARADEEPAEAAPEAAAEAVPEAAAEAEPEIGPTQPAPCEGKPDCMCRREWVCALKVKADGTYDCTACKDCAAPGAPCAAPRGCAPCAPVRGRCCWQRVPVYRTVCCPKYETREIPCHTTRRVPRYEEVEVAVYTRRCVPVTREYCDPCTGVVRTVNCGYRMEREQTGTKMRRVLKGYDTERVESGTRTVRYRVGWESRQVVCGYRCCRVPVRSTTQPPTAGGAPTSSPCVAGHWVTVVDCEDTSGIEPLEHTTEVIPEAKYAILKKACKACVR